MELPQRKKTKSAHKFMSCWNCPRYDRANFHCLDGKSNPRKKTDSVMLVEHLGLRMLCHYNLYRDSLAMKIHFPKDPTTIYASARVVKSKFRIEIEPDIAANFKCEEV